MNKKGDQEKTKQKDYFNHRISSKEQLEMWLLEYSPL